MHRIASRIELDDLAGCWKWRGTISRKGYGTYSGRQAHREVYQMVIGPVPGGLVLDHLCRNRSCVNPAHVEPVTDGVNIRRGISPSILGLSRDTCRNGHPRTEATTYVHKGSRICRPCNTAANARYRARR